jgi:hypothetical protein
MYLLFYVLEFIEKLSAMFVLKKIKNETLEIKKWIDALIWAKII